MPLVHTTGDWTDAAAARRAIVAALLLPGVVALAAALVAERVFGVLGCDLCVLARYPYVVTTVIAGVALVRPSPRVQRIVFPLCAALFAIDCAIAVYHSGIQQGWWSEAGLCTGALPPVPADLRTLRVERRPACDEIDWSALGLSLAALNAIYAAAAALVAARLAALVMRRRAPIGGSP